MHFVTRSGTGVSPAADLLPGTAAKEILTAYRKGGFTAEPDRLQITQGSTVSVGGGLLMMSTKGDVTSYEETYQGSFSPVNHMLTSIGLLLRARQQTAIPEIQRDAYAGIALAVSPWPNAWSVHDLTQTLRWLYQPSTFDLRCQMALMLLVAGKIDRFPSLGVANKESVIEAAELHINQHYGHTDSGMHFDIAMGLLP